MFGVSKGEDKISVLVRTVNMLTIRDDRRPCIERSKHLPVPNLIVVPFGSRLTIGSGRNNDVRVSQYFSDQHGTPERIPLVVGTLSSGYFIKGFRQGLGCGIVNFSDERISFGWPCTKLAQGQEDVLFDKDSVTFGYTRLIMKETSMLRYMHRLLSHDELKDLELAFATHTDMLNRYDKLLKKEKRCEAKKQFREKQAVTCAMQVLSSELRASESVIDTMTCK
jgi:hypothetical protein